MGNVHWTCNAASNAVATVTVRRSVNSTTTRPNVTITEPPAKAAQQCSREQLEKTFGNNTVYTVDNATDVTVVTIYTASGSIGAEDLAAASDRCFDFWGGPKYCSEWRNSSSVWGCGKG